MSKTKENLSKLEPKSLWENFIAICDIPHPSKKEEEIAKFLEEFGKNLGLESERDEANNVIIKKPATKGMEDLKTVVLQAHVDMVPQKNNDTAHDFEKDPITAYIDGEWVKAKGTTLGADNGIGAAAMMAILQSKDIPHGTIEAVFTTDEETGFTGAAALESGKLDGEFLLNLDTEDEDELCIGCAGGAYVNGLFHYEETAVPEDVLPFQIIVKGLAGGHSGCDIHLQRGNSIKILTRILWDAGRKFDMLLAEIEAGAPLHNAIPRESSAIIVIPSKHEQAFVDHTKTLIKDIQDELASADPNLKIELTKTDMPKAVIDEKTQYRLLNALYACPNGVIRMCDDVPGLVETSTNLGHIKSENGKIDIFTLQRSSVDSAKTDISNKVQCVLELAEADFDRYGDYPGWPPNVNSPLLKLMKELFKKHFLKDPKVNAIHAGLECGLLGDKYPKLDIISFGPTIKFAHSPDEKVHIESVERFWNFLQEILKNIPKKGA